MQDKGKKRVTKQELQEFIKTNQIQIQEVIYKKPENKKPLADQYIRSWTGGDKSKIQIPGGEHYQKLILTIPEHQFHKPEADFETLFKKKDLAYEAVQAEKQFLKNQYIEETKEDLITLGDERFSAWLEEEPFNHNNRLSKLKKKQSDVIKELNKTVTESPFNIESR